MHPTTNGDARPWEVEPMRDDTRHHAAAIHDALDSCACTACEGKRDTSPERRRRTP